MILPSANREARVLVTNKAEFPSSGTDARLARWLHAPDRAALGDTKGPIKYRF